MTEISEKYIDVFGKTAEIAVRSPGRINLIGEHTDYNDGFVFPAAIDKAIYFAASKNDLGLFRFISADYNERFELEVAQLSVSKTPWANYLLGVAEQFVQAGYKIGGIDCVFGGDIPIGAGLSSSAAIETGFALVIDKLFDCNVSKLDQVKMSQKAEHEYAGVMCGIMDQFVIVHGRADSAIKLDCRSLDFEYAHIDLSDFDIVLCDTKVKHSLASSAYNTRRQECESGVKILQKFKDGITALRDVDIALLQEHKDVFDENVYKRCKYVVEENERVNQAFEALHQGDVKQLGELMLMTHEGLKDEFEVSCSELDLLVDLAKASEEIIGVRMMGGGFGGCTINLVKKEGTAAFSKKIATEYEKATGTAPEIHIVKIADGTAVI